MVASDRYIYLTTGIGEGRELFCYSYEETTGVSGWSPFKLGKPSNYNSNDTHNPVISDMASFTFEQYDPLFNIIRRERVAALVRVGNGSQGHSLCVLNPPWDLDHPSVHAFAGAASPTYWAPYHMDFLAAATNISPYVWELPPLFSWGLLNPTGIKAHVIADGAYIGEFACDSLRRITLPMVAIVVRVGFVYEGEIITMPFSEQGQNGPTHGRPRRVHETIIRFYKTLGGKIGRADQANLDEIPFRDPLQPMNQPTDFFTGEKKVAFPAGYERDYAVKIVQNLPFPMSVSYIAMNGISYD
jgi:hypothetical protein